MNYDYISYIDCSKLYVSYVCVLQMCVYRVSFTEADAGDAVFFVCFMCDFRIFTEIFK